MAGRHSPKPAEQPSRQVVFCDTVGCEQRAVTMVGDRKLCQSCQDEIRRRKSAGYCKAEGLNTVAEMRAHCLRLARRFAEPSFERWCKVMSQKTVDWIALHNGKDDEKCLERLRAAGVIDGRNKIIPLEGRTVAAAAYRAERARLICKVDQELKARGVVEREPGQDEQETAS